MKDWFDKFIGFLSMAALIAVCLLVVGGMILVVFGVIGGD